MEELILNYVLKQLDNHLLEYLGFLELRAEDVLQLVEAPVVEVFHVPQPVLLVHTPHVMRPHALLEVFPVCLSVCLLVFFNNTILIEIGKII